MHDGGRVRGTPTVHDGGRVRGTLTVHGRRWKDKLSYMLQLIGSSLLRASSTLMLHSSSSPLQFKSVALNLRETFKIKGKWL